MPGRLESGSSLPAPTPSPVRPVASIVKKVTSSEFAFWTIPPTRSGICRTFVNDSDGAATEPDAYCAIT